MLLIRFHSQDAFDKFFDHTVFDDRLRGTAWRAGWGTVIVASYQEDAIQRLFQAHGGADVIPMTQDLPMFGQVLRQDRIYDQKVCIRCKHDFTGKADFYTEVEVNGDPQVLCKGCIYAIAEGVKV